MLGSNNIHQESIVKKSVLALSCLVLGAVSQVAAQAPSKVGIIHIQNAILSTKDGQTALKAIEERSAPKKKELEKKQSEIQALRDQLNKLGSVGSEEQKQKLMRDIDAKTKVFNRDVEDAQAEFDQENGKVFNELGGKVMVVLDKYAKDNGYALIFDVSNQQTSQVLFAANGIDITQEVVSLYDKNAPAAGAPTPAATKPAAAPPTKPPAAAPKK
jgi:outer membrane protein